LFQIKATTAPAIATKKPEAPPTIWPAPFVCVEPEAEDVEEDVELVVPVAVV
jgi:hypothetical protein